jgi:hypothetical protein
MIHLARPGNADPRAHARTRTNAARARSRPGHAFMRALGAILAFGASVACDNPCENLHKRVCEDPTYLRENKRHCELMSEQNRREALPRDYCESILKSIQRR